MARKSDIRLRRSNVANAVPGGADLNEGELAINTADGALYFKKSDGTIITGHDNTIMHVDSTNSRVGIGTTSPATELDVNGVITGSGLLKINEGANLDGHTIGRLVINYQSNGDPALASHGGDTVHIEDDLTIKGANLTKSSTAPADFNIRQARTGYDIVFQTAPSTNSTFVDAMKILTDGKVGIGTSSPGQRLHVSGGVSRFQGTTSNWLEIDSTSGSGNDVTLSTRFNTLRFDVPSANSAAYDFKVGGSSKLLMDDNGNVGIGTGTNTLSNILQVDGVAAIFDGLRLGSAASGEGLIRHGGPTANGVAITTGALSSPHIKLFVAHANDGGGVGIGTTSPSEKLDVRDGTITSRDSTNTNYAEIDRFAGLTLKGNGTGAKYITTPNTDDLGFKTNNIERARIDSSGNLLVSTTNAAVDTGVASGVVLAASDQLLVGTNAAHSAAFNRIGGASGDIIQLKHNGTKVGSIGSRASAVSYIVLDSRSASNGGVGIGTTSQAIVPTDYAGANVNGTKDLGNASYQWKDLHLGGTGYFGTSVGIGTTSPATKLELFADNPVLRLRDSKVKGSSWAAGDALGGLEFYTSDTTGIGTHTVASIKVVNGGEATQSPDGEIVFSTGAYNTAASEVMRIDSSGRLNMTSSAGASPVLYHGNDLTSTSPTTNLSFGNEQNGALLIYTNSTERMRIDSSGNVGLGITNPSSYWGQADNLVVGGTGNDGITIKSSAAGNGRLAFTDTASTTAGLNDGGLISYAHATDAMIFRTNGSDAMRILSDGNTIFGGTSVGAAGAMSVKVDGTYTDLYLYGAGTSQGGRIFFGDSSDRSSITGTYGSGGGGKLTFKTDTTGGTSQDRLVIDSDGSITFNNAFTFPTTIGSAGQVLKVPTSGTSLIWGNASGGGGGSSIEDNDGDTKIQVEETADEDIIRFDIAGTEQLQLNSTGLVVAGNLTVNGTQTALNVATLDVEDKNITLNYGSGDTTGSANGAGITIQDAVDASTDATILWDTTNDEFDFSHGINTAGTITTQKIIGTQTQGSSLYGLKLTRSSSGTTTPDLWGQNDTLVIGTSSSTEAVAFSSADSIFYGDLTIPTKIRHSGDTDNYISFPAADTQSFVTGNSTRFQISNSLARFNQEGLNQDFQVFGQNNDNLIFADASTDRVGIGTNVPETKLHVQNGSDTSPAVIITGGHNGRRLKIQSYQTGGAAGAGFIFNADSSYGALKFQTTSTDRMVITQPGNVGIGTASPSHLLHLKDTNPPTILFEEDSGGTQTAKISYSQAGQNALTISTQYQSSSDSNRINFAPADNLAMTIRGGTGIKDGFVGIGTEYPEENLEIHDTTMSTISLSYEGNSGNGSSIDFNLRPSSAIASPLTSQIKATDDGAYRQNISFSTKTNAAASSGLTTRMMIKADGKVGIGTTSPSKKFEVHDNGKSFKVGEKSGYAVSYGPIIETNSDAIVMPTTVWLNNSNVRLYKTGTSARLHGDGGIEFGVYNGSAAIEAMRIKNDGKVGIGTTSPTAKLHIDQTGNTRNDGLFIERNGSTYGLNLYVDSGGYGVIGGNGGFTPDIIKLDFNQEYVGVGLSPQAKFQVNSDTTIGWSNLANAFILAGTTTAGIGIDNNEIMAKGAGNLYFGTGGSNEDVIIRAGGTTAAMTISGSNQRVGIAKSIPLARFQVEEYGIDTTTSSTTATTQVAIHTFPIANFRSARFTIQITNTTDSTYHSTEILAIHDGTTANITEFGEVHTGSSVEATFDADISSSNFRLLATPTSTNSMTFKVVCHSLTV